jgi:hypothetical protein
VQPQEGTRVVACAASRYEFEVFSGTVAGAPKSEALNAGESLLKRVLGFGKGRCQATHEMVVRTPDGVSRTFRFGTASADVPAQVRMHVSRTSYTGHVRALAGAHACPGGPATGREAVLAWWALETHAWKACRSRTAAMAAWSDEQATAACRRGSG